LQPADATPATITFFVDGERHRRVAEFAGVIGDRDLLGAFAAMLSAPDYDQTLDDLVDLSRVTQMLVTSAGLQRLIALYDERSAQGAATRSAIIAPTDVLYGVSRMFQAMRGEQTFDELEVFRSRDGAVAWFDVGPADRSG